MHYHHFSTSHLSIQQHIYGDRHALYLMKYLTEMRIDERLLPYMHCQSLLSVYILSMHMHTHTHTHTRTQNTQHRHVTGSAKALHVRTCQHFETQLLL